MTTPAFWHTTPVIRHSAVRPFASFLVLFLVLTSFVFGFDSTPKQFNIPADTAEKSLKLFSKQSGLEVIFATKVTREVRTHPVKGEMVPREALDTMLAGTGLTVIQDDSTGAFTVRQQIAANNQKSDGPAASDPPASDPSQPGSQPPPNSAPNGDTTTTTVSVTAVVSSAQEEAPTEMSPFVISAREDRESYKANSTLAGTRVRTDLSDIASAISVVTQQFLQDTGATNSQDLLVYTPNTEVAGLNGNFTGQAGQAQYSEQLTNPSSVTRVRGLDTADNTRDYFLTDIPWDSFDTGRIDLQRGPNSILFGVGSPAGIINNSINGAEYVNTYKIVNRVGSYDSIRDSVDLNQVLIPNELAIRVSLLDDDEKYQQKPAFNNDGRIFMALRWDPNLFGKKNHTTIRANFEKGSVSSNNPRALPPDDLITPWFQTGTVYGNPALNKLTVNQWAIGNGTNGLGDFNSPSAALYAKYTGWVQGDNISSNILTIYNGANPTTGAIPIYSSTPTGAIQAQIGSNGGRDATGWAINSAGVVNGVIGDFPTYAPLEVPSFSVFGENSAQAVGGDYFVDKVIQNPSIFNFYDNLLDGPNKKEWQNWKAGNASISQTFFGDRLAFELAYDKESYTSGSQSPLVGHWYAISVDVNQTLTDGTANPNVGRPYVDSSFSAGPSDNATTNNRQSIRFTTNLELRSEDLFNRSMLTEILGRHILTLLADEDKKDTSELEWAQYANSESYPALEGPNVPIASLYTNRIFDFVDYLGPSLLGASSASGANISPITNVISIPSESPAEYFNSHWNAPNVNPANPYTYISHTTGLPVNGTQSDNPANYVGWQTVPMTWLSASNPQEFPDLVTGAEKTKYSDVNQGFTWQAYMFDDTLISTFGYRKDRVTNYGSAAPQNSVSGLINTDFSIDPSTRTSASGDSRSWGFVYHLPKSLTSHLPWDSTISLFYDTSNNFKADVPRQNLIGDAIPNPQGKTKEYGFTISALKDKVTLKVDWYATHLNNATFEESSGIGVGGLPNGWFLWAAPDWGLQDAAFIQNGLEGINNQNASSWNYAYIDGVPGSVGGPGNPGFDNAPETALEKQIVQAWLNIPLSASFFQFYGVHPLSINPAAGLATGQIRDDFGGAFDENDTNTGAQQWSGSSNAVTTTDLLSKGTEIEVTGQLTKNWNLTANYSRTFATHSSIDPTTTAFMAQQYAFFTGVAGQLRLGAGPASNAIGPSWINFIYDPYLVEVATEGHSAPEIAPWRVNIITTYTFDRGPLKGWFVGGASRMEAGRILGYAFDPTTNFLNVNQPWIGQTDTHFDGWVGYSRRVFNNKVNWRIQANLRNILEKAHLEPDSVEPDGTYALERIEDGMTWTLSNTFEF
jgi:hypothetical protein